MKSHSSFGVKSPDLNMYAQCTINARHEPHPCCNLCHLHVLLLYTPLRSQKLVLEINLAPKCCNKLVLVLLLLHPNHVKAHTPLHPWKGTVPRKV
jgi:hypothetical protein